MKGRTIVITSGKGGVGKTTATANLGTGLAMRGHRVVVVDTDIGLRNLDVIMGLENRIVYDVVNVIEGTCKLSQALIGDKHDFELYLIPAAQTRDKNSIEPEQLRELCAELEEQFDYVLIDCPAGIEQGFKNATAAAKEAIIVTTPEVSAIRDADRVIGLLESAGLHRPRLIINRIAPEMVKRGDMMDQKDVEALLAVEVIGLVPADENTVVAANRGVPVVHNPKSSAGQAFLRIAARVDGEDIPLMDLEPKTGLISRFKDLVGIGGRTYSHA
ncbi:MAG: septum site-determining protein MinD [Chloroflexi bacterium]|nr:septum site-determining protein MinD [Chloroflexota bacterium]MDA1272119.1 septum site-determining protein MinD [Chloroflexota bacterium]PKB58565.1 MAG: septum site-determining protein MinD [SAR202 cluster bacterium Casp-Chloro-G2]